MNTQPTFNWNIFLARLATFGVSGFLAVFSASYTTSHSWQSALSAALSALVAAVFLGAGYDHEQYQNSVRAFKAQQVQTLSNTVHTGPHDPVVRK